MGCNTSRRDPVSHSHKVLGRDICLMPEKFSEFKAERAVGRDE
jgi:hypothetical protein